MKKTFNTRITSMPSDLMGDFVSKIPNIDSAIDLTYGEPGFAVDEIVKTAAKLAIDNDRSHYAPSQGIKELRSAAVNYYNNKFDLNFADANNAIVTLGVSEAINVVFLTLLNIGDGIIVPEPGYSPYSAVVNFVGANKVSIDTSKTDFKLTPESVQAAIDKSNVKVKAILLNYPNNPTGTTYSKTELKELANVFKKNDIWVISDEIYAELTYEQEHVSMRKLLPEQTILVTGLSKSHAMTGYRIGFILADEDVVEQMMKVHESLVFAIPTLLQDAALAALTKGKGIPEKAKVLYKKRRDKLKKELEELEFDIADPQGAFYLFAKIPEKLHMDGETFALALAKEKQVVVLPGDVFSDETKNYIRISYANDEEQLFDAIEKIKHFVQGKEN